MVPSPEPTLTDSPELPPSGELYYIIPLSFTPKWKLELTNATGDVIYRVSRRPTAPPLYLIQPVSGDEPLASLTIRVKVSNRDVRFILYKGEERLYIMRLNITKQQFLVQNSSREILARFIPITPEITLLRTIIGNVARIRAKVHPSPIGVTMECKITQPQKWLLPVLLYAIARIEEVISAPPHEKEPTAESAEIDAP